MTKEDISTIQRMLGKIEAVAFVVDDKFQILLLDALEVLDEIFDSEVGDNNAE